jgi:hypothetical protein
MLRKILPIVFVLCTNLASGQYTTQKEYSHARYVKDFERGQLRHINIYNNKNLQQWRVTIRDADASCYDTTYYIYKDTFLIERIECMKGFVSIENGDTQMLSPQRPNFLKPPTVNCEPYKNGKADTIRRKYFYNAQGLLSRQEYSSYEDTVIISKDSLSKLKFEIPRSAIKRKWRYLLTSNYSYDSKDRLLKIDGYTNTWDGFVHGEVVVNGNASKYFFYDKTGTLVKDSIIDHEDGKSSIGLYSYTNNKYEILRVINESNSDTLKITITQNEHDSL